MKLILLIGFILVCVYVYAMVYFRMAYSRLL